MKEVRVLKEMPFAKVGEEFEVNDQYIDFGNGWSCSGGQAIGQNIDAGWLEWVKEERSLEEEFDEADNNAPARLISSNRSKAQIATDHERKRYMKKFDKAVKPGSVIYYDKPRDFNICDYIRKAMFGSEERE